MAQFLSIFKLFCVFWICSLETSARSNQDGSDLIQDVISTLLSDTELTDIKDIHSKNHMLNEETGVHMSKDIRNTGRHDTGAVRDVESGDKHRTRLYKPEYVNKESNMLLEEITAILSSERARRKKQKKWFDQDGARGTPPTITSTTTGTEPTTETS